jgi:hypothetical protein
LANIAVHQGTNRAEMPWFQLTKGLAEYRLGHFSNAVEWTQKVPIGGIPERDVEAYSVLAMAHYHLHQLDESHAVLAKGVEIADTKLPKLENGGLDDAWVDWIIAHALMDEAKALIDGGTNPTTSR